MISMIRLARGRLIGLRIMMGTLTLDAVPEDQVADCEHLAFNPMHLTKGIEASDDPVLRVREEAYNLSRDDAPESLGMPIFNRRCDEGRADTELARLVG